MQPTFKDSQGREYKPVLDFAKLREIRKLTGIDLGVVTELGQSWLRILDSADVAATCLWVAVSDRAGITEDEFLSALDAERVEEGCDALLEAVRNFTPPRMRGLVDKGPVFIHQNYKEVIELQEAIVQAATKRATEEAIERLGMQQQSAPESSATLTTAGV